MEMHFKMRLILQYSLVIFLWLTGAKGVGLHGACEDDQECGTIDTFCHKNVCVCKENFTVLFDSCIALAQPRESCTHKNECHKVLGPKSICTKKKQCACKPFHHLHMRQCVKNRDLSHQCDHDHQCYCGAGCEEKIACIHHSCTCRSKYKPFGARRCLVSQDNDNTEDTDKTEDTNISENDSVTTTYDLTSSSTLATVITNRTFVGDLNVTSGPIIETIKTNNLINTFDKDKELNVSPNVILQSGVMNGLTMSKGLSKSPNSIKIFMICVILLKKFT